MNRSMDELLKRSSDMVNQKRLTLVAWSQEKEPISRRLNKRFVALCVSLVVCFTIVTLSFSPKVLAYVVNLLSGSPLYQQVVEKGLTTSVEKGASIQGITLNVENVYVDQGELVFDMVQSYAKDLAYKPVLNSNDVQLFINGKKLAFHTGGEFHTLPDNKYGGIIYYNGNYEGEPKMLLPETFQLTVQVDKIENVNGNWTIELPVSRKLSDRATKTYEPVVSNKVDEITITVSKVIIRPLSTLIDYELTVPNNYTFADPSSIKSIQVKDEKGNSLGIAQIAGEETNEGSVKTIRFTGEYQTPIELPEQLVIIPQRDVEDKRTDSVIYYHGEPIEELIYNIPLRK
jgi:hypothetical protein